MHIVAQIYIDIHTCIPYLIYCLFAVQIVCGLKNGCTAVS